MLLENKVALITGGSRGIGREIALKLADEGAKIAINFTSNVAKAEEVQKEIESKGKEVILVKGDVSNVADAEKIALTMFNKFGRIDILVNNAGITRDSLLLRMKDSDFDDVINTNLKGVYNCTKQIAKYMIKNHYGRIVNMSSIVALTGNVGQTNYSAAKAGIIGFSKSVAKELASRGVTVNVVAPGFIKTDMTDSLPERIKESMLKEIPVGRIGTPEDIANVVKFLVSDSASYITGQVIRVDGGLFM